MQTVSALKCPTCRPLLTKLQKSEKKLEQLAEERTTQMEDLHQIKYATVAFIKKTVKIFQTFHNVIHFLLNVYRREALKTAVSEKDAHLALLELSGLKTISQFEQAEKLKVDRKILLEKLKEEVSYFQV